MWAHILRAYLYKGVQVVTLFPILLQGSFHILESNVQCGKQILSEEWIEESTKPSDTDYYGYLFWRGEYNSFRADGKYSQLSIVIPDKNTVISLVAECRKGEELMRALYDFVCSKL